MNFSHLSHVSSSNYLFCNKIQISSFLTCGVIRLWLLPNDEKLPKSVCKDSELCVPVPVPSISDETPDEEDPTESHDENLLWLAIGLSLIVFDGVTPLVRLLLCIVCVCCFSLLVLLQTVLFSKFLRISARLSFRGGSSTFAVVLISVDASCLTTIGSLTFVASLRTHFAISDNMWLACGASFFTDAFAVVGTDAVIVFVVVDDVSFFATGKIELASGFSSESDDITSTYVATFMTLSTILSPAETSL